jgi:hypothetical protein
MQQAWSTFMCWVRRSSLHIHKVIPTNVYGTDCVVTAKPVEAMQFKA